MRNDYGKLVKSVDIPRFIKANIVVRMLLFGYQLPILSLLILCSLFSACSSGSDDDLKAIWSYEQNQFADPNFQFYPLETRTVGQITVKDSLTFIEKSLGQPIDTLLKQNSKALQGLLQLQSLYVKYDMESARENLSMEIEQLESSQKWLNTMKTKLANYQELSSNKVLIRKVECSFQYNLPISSQKVTRDKIYFIQTASGRVIQAQDKPSLQRNTVH